MKCAEFETRLHELLDERQHPEDDAPLCDHARTCDSCFLILQTQERLFYALARRTCPESSSKLSRRVLDAMQPQPSSQARRSWGNSPLLVAAAAVAALLLFTLLPFLRSAPDSTANSIEAPRDVAPPIPAEPDRLTSATALREAAIPSGPSETAPPVEPHALATATDSNELYRRWLVDMAEHVQRISTDPPLPVNELTSSFWPVAGSISGALGALRQTLPGGKPIDVAPGAEVPQAIRLRELGRVA